MIIDVQLNFGIVIEVGVGLKNKEGKLIFFDVKKGDIVFFLDYGGSYIKFEGRE